MQLKDIKVSMAVCAVLMGIGVAHAAPASEDAGTIAVYHLSRRTAARRRRGEPYLPVHL